MENAIEAYLNEKKAKLVRLSKEDPVFYGTLLGLSKHIPVKHDFIKNYCKVFVYENCIAPYCDILAESQYSEHFEQVDYPKNKADYVQFDLCCDMESGGIVITRNKIQIITLFSLGINLSLMQIMILIRSEKILSKLLKKYEKIQNTYKDYLINNYELDNLRKQKDNLNTNSSSGDFVVLVDDALPF